MDDFIEVYDNALPPELCAEILQRFEASPHVGRGVTGNGVDVEKKDSYDLTITNFPDWRDISQKLADNTLRYMCEYMGKYRFLLMGALSPSVVDPESGQPAVLGPENFDRLGVPLLADLVKHMYRLSFINVQKYLQGTGGYHHWHSEIYPQNQTCETLHRVLLYQYYLNDVTEGGETEFLYQNRKVAPKAGRLVIAPAGFTHTHKGHIPLSGDKTIVNSWVLFQRAEAMYGQ
ncbi:2OG-Fe(II) oxygenase [Parachitinimonas caeni]|uniref:2OG-Fe(II) oxygenase n=1 Tax=Parachitinimonas caeni TaxID=3031301 RepID=A0ABT7E0Y2_9NEIS|nr:2OG-Fe(II) oxygenase [Parachitinimonas caeni]MDK2125977.1 2OG-Fe(II) oxygenase [Parachitinimonas caeni]